MKFFNIKRKSNKETINNVSPSVFPDKYSEEGLCLSLSESNAELKAYLSQLEDEAYGEKNEKEQFLIPWGNIYELIKDADHKTSIPLLNIPEQETLIPILSSNAGISDSNFSISIGWESSRKIESPKVQGAIANIGGTLALLPESHWQLRKKIKEFAKINQEKTPSLNKLYWGHIRRLAKQANAKMDHFLSQTIVLTPESLDIDMRKVDVNGVKVVEVAPKFKDAPTGWIESFDRYSSVRDHYEISDVNGLVHIVIPPEVKTVLSEIKRMPGRRVSGKRAEAFIRNPFALLGESASNIISEESFEKSLQEAGIDFYGFTSKITKNEKEKIVSVSLLIQPTGEGSATSETYLFESPERLLAFIEQAERSILEDHQCCFWEGWELEIQGNTREQILALKSAYANWLESPMSIDLSNVFDLSNYSGRIEGIGEEKPYYSPFIVKNKEDEGWFPENITYGIFWTPEGESASVGMALEKQDFAKLEKEYEQAKQSGKSTFSYPGFKQEIQVSDIQPAIERLKQVFSEVEARKFDPSKEHKKDRVSLVIKPNIERLDYEESRNRLDEISMPKNSKPKLPKSLRHDVNLKDYQQQGVAWLQYLWRKSPTYCRGAIMADDMGLGKTLQLLTFVISCLEGNKDLAPILIVAPVSLLDNWLNEIKKFFKDNAATILTLYGPQLSNAKLPKTSIDSQLVSKGLTKFLKPDWIGDAKIVLTTYETLRDMEFSFADKKWSVMICDEAQRIKSPNAMVTRSAKKMNVQFKIACTGTPVENTLADLWCLFDFIQPGMLGALNKFCTKYRRPIETKTEEEKSRIDELRKLIDPQILRRTKKDVAKDLPKKEIIREYLPISPYQRNLCAHIHSLKNKARPSVEKNGVKNPLELISYLRQVCADPRPLGQRTDSNEPFSEYSSKSPKISWLMDQLTMIQKKNEKVIIFTEIRDLQRIIQKFINDQFLFNPEIINGETSVDSKKNASRQQKLDIFQKGKGFSAIILSPLAVGFGVNIQKANHVIHFTRHWNPAKEDQATDRAYRIGQEKDVFVYYPLIYAGVPVIDTEIGFPADKTPPFKTFDVKLDELLEQKRSLSDDILNGTGNIEIIGFHDLTDGMGEKIMDDRDLTIDDVLLMEAATFEVFCSILWTKMGYQTAYKTPQSGDGGIDVVAFKEKSGVLIQCKTVMEEDARLGWDAVKEVVAGTKAYEIKHPDINFGRVCVTNRCFNETAIKQAEYNDVKLIDKDELSEILLKNRISQLELEQALIDMSPEVSISLQ